MNNIDNQESALHESILRCLEIIQRTEERIMSHKNWENPDKFALIQFSELKEGDYQIKIKSDNIKKQFVIKNTDLIVHITTGKETIFTFNVEEKKKQIQFQKEKIILTDL